MASTAGLGLMGKIRALLRAPWDLLIVLGIKWRAQLWSFLYPKPLYHPLRENQLRLLTIHPALTPRRDELVRVTLHHVSLEYTPEYKKWEESADPDLRLQKKTYAWFAKVIAEHGTGKNAPTRFTWGDYMALSYYWGNGVRSHRIIVNGQIFPVTETLESALRSMRGEMGTLKLWADAICINQDDIAERGREVRRMRSIYGNPAAVYVHLGPEADNSSLAMQVIEQMNTFLRDGHDVASNVLQTAVAIQEGRGDASQDAIIAIFKLLCRPYWSRMWIIQELAMGDDQVVVGCGNRGLQLSDLRQMLKLIVLNQASFNVIIGEDLLRECAERYQSAIQILWSATRLRDLALAPPERSFSFSEICHPILRLSQYASATDPRDKVYGAMSLMPSRLIAKIDQGEKNYTFTTKEVFTNFTKSIIEATNDLDVIWNASLQQKSLSKLDLPSWSPDWTLKIGRSSATGSSQEWFFGPDERYSAFDKAYNLPTEWYRDPSRADGGRHPKYHFTSDDRLLLCEGFEIASVSSMAHEIEVITRVTSEPNLQVQSDHVMSPYNSDQEVREALLRTLLLDASGHFTNDSIVLQLPWFGDDPDALSGEDEAVNALLQEMGDKGWDLRSFGGGLSTFEMYRQQIRQFVVGNKSFREYFPDEVVSCPATASFLEFNIIASNLVARRLIITSTGHIGLAPTTIFPGDKIYVIIGSGMPVILRPNGAHYEVVGECFVDGFMRGEAMQAFDDGSYQLQEISLC